MVRLSAVDLLRRVAVVHIMDDGRDENPHVLRGTLAAMLSEPTWHVVVAFDEDGPPSTEVATVLAQAHRWAGERDCRMTVTTVRDLRAVT
jgi:hypothetical protein